MLPLSNLAIRRWLLSIAEGEIFEGIKIIDVSLHREVDQRFRANTVKALELINSVDPRRFHRIQRQIKYIVNCEGLKWASYDRGLKSCEVDYSRIDDTSNEQWYLWCYATTLVHEATHGAIYSRYIDYTQKLRPRIERLCHKEEKRFASRFDTSEIKWSEALLGTFDERDWHKSWNSTFLQRFKDTINRHYQSWKSMRSKKDKQKQGSQ